MLAGAIGTAGGVTSLVSFPALLLAGVAPLTADVTDIAALVVCWPGSAVASRAELIAAVLWGGLRAGGALAEGGYPSSGRYSRCPVLSLYHTRIRRPVVGSTNTSSVGR